MKNLFTILLICLGSVYLATGQEIIPFPDLSENRIAVYNQTETIEESNYSLYTKDYQEALKDIDREIQVLDSQIENESNKIQRTSLQSEKANLLKNRTRLIHEAELLEDLNKFY